MKMHVIGVKRVSGLSKAGNDFDMCSVLCLVPIETGSHGKVAIEGYGSELAEIGCESKAVSQFSKLKLPAEVDLLTEQRFFRGKFETVVVGVANPLSAVGAKG